MNAETHAWVNAVLAEVAAEYHSNASKLPTVHDAALAAESAYRVMSRTRPPSREVAAQWARLAAVRGMAAFLRVVYLTEAAYRETARPPAPESPDKG